MSTPTHVASASASGTFHNNPDGAPHVAVNISLSISNDKGHVKLSADPGVASKSGGSPEFVTAIDCDVAVVKVVGQVGSIADEGFACHGEFTNPAGAVQGVNVGLYRKGNAYFVSYVTSGEWFGVSDPLSPPPILSGTASMTLT